MARLPRLAGTALAAALLVGLASCGAPPADPAAAGMPAPAAEAAEVHPLERLPAGPAGHAVRRAIEAAGSWQAWEEKAAVDYRKTTRSFAPDGSVAREVVERHRYRLHPPLGVRIERESEEGPVVLLNKGDQAWKTVGGAVATSQQDRDQAWNSTFGSHYVFAMPFKLTDPGTVLEHLGERELPDGTVAEAVRATYEPGAGSAAGMHAWTYYFALADGRLVANRLQHGPAAEDCSYTEYLDHRQVDDLVLPTRRVSYSCDAAAERLAKTSEMFHQDVRFVEPLPEELFLPAGRGAAAE